MRRPHRLARICILSVVVWAVGCGNGGQATRREFDLDVRGEALPAAERLIRADQGDDIVLRWSADEPTAVHLHGYDIEKAIEPGAVTTMSFVATATGRFPITRHGHGQETPLAYLEVRPR